MLVFDGSHFDKAKLRQTETAEHSGVDATVAMRYTISNFRRDSLRPVAGAETHVIGENTLAESACGEVRAHEPPPL